MGVLRDWHPDTRCGACRSVDARPSVVSDTTLNYVDRIVSQAIAARPAIIAHGEGQSPAKILGSNCSGGQLALDRLGQLEPEVLVTADGYRFGNKSHDKRAAVEQVRAGLPTLAATVVVSRLCGFRVSAEPGLQFMSPKSAMPTLG